VNKKKVKALIKEYKKKLDKRENQAIIAVESRNKALKENKDLRSENQKLRAAIKQYQLTHARIDRLLE